MKINKYDLFSSEFYFNLDGQNYKKGTIQGVIFSFLSITLVLSYFAYLLQQYLNNMIDPQYKSQSFITNTIKEVPLTEDLLAFQFNYNNSLSIDQYQAIQNKTYLVYYPYFYYQDTNNNIYQVINLEVVQCTSSQLLGYNCIDFSQLSNYTLIFDNQNSIISQIYLNIYGCLDLDEIKTTIPNNCASQSEIDSVINGAQAGLVLWLKTQQYNTTSMEIQTDYRFLESFSYSNQFMMSTIKAQMQETHVKQGLIIQGQQFYSSPIQYGQTIYTYDKQFSLSTGLGPYLQVNLQLDEIVQFIQIQYPAITQILALVNSISFVVMIFRTMARLLSQNLIRKEFFVLILRNLFQEKCQQILQKENLMGECDIQVITQEKEEEFLDDIQENQRKASLFLPDFQYRFFQKRQKSYLQLDKSNSFQKQILQIDAQYEQKSNIKLDNSLNSLAAKKDNQNQQKLFLNLSNVDKVDLINKNEYLSTQQIDSKILSQQQKESQAQKQLKIQSKQQQFQKSNFKDQLQKQQSEKKKKVYDAISQKLQVMKSLSIKQAIQNTIFKFKCFKVKDYLTSRGIKEKQMEKMQNEVQDYQNINSLYQDLIFLKKAMSMILSLDQMAAIQLIGLTDDYMNLDLNSQDSKIIYQCIFLILKDVIKHQQIFYFIEERKKLNHFEKFYTVLKQQQLQIDYIEKFLTKCQESDNLSEIDKRILYSVIKKK
ncbi:AMP-binding enzyme family protein (macronuclear) [Tetrahymena thermophila SB210]|uniref:AMP-binding enzyme family protein n=1 Tax=Tetrahymena thermophila (strain SB210) TaxID=312017 RepID=Q23JE7_TETTS|nr:AMP-binding enzyme family protein [Tetrahymena thermophila SB210]EAR96557.2 AMP-binding enzyme family protein [Tetrahymena thermophila SB210]|eukprot:XP_001016802.2 AMP-binding enzyme family protein [Tetrahymena thermophila SB210]